MAARPLLGVERRLERGCALIMRLSHRPHLRRLLVSLSLRLGQAQIQLVHKPRSRLRTALRAAYGRMTS